MQIMGIMVIRVLFDLQLFGVFGGKIARWPDGEVVEHWLQNLSFIRELLFVSIRG
jgi:hypothetical protein